MFLNRREHSKSLFRISSFWQFGKMQHKAVLCRNGTQLPLSTTSSPERINQPLKANCYSISMYSLITHSRLSLCGPGNTKLSLTHGSFINQRTFIISIQTTWGILRYGEPQYHYKIQSAGCIEYVPWLLPCEKLCWHNERGICRARDKAPAPYWSDLGTVDIFNAAVESPLNVYLLVFHNINQAAVPLSGVCACMCSHDCMCGSLGNCLVVDFASAFD